MQLAETVQNLGIEQGGERRLDAACYLSIDGQFVTYNHRQVNTCTRVPQQRNMFFPSPHLGSGTGNEPPICGLFGSPPSLIDPAEVETSGWFLEFLG